MESQHCSFTHLKILYAECVGKIIEQAFVADHGDDAFKEFEELAEKAKGKHDAVTKNMTSLHSFDWQACNRTFENIKPARVKVFEYHNVPKKTQDWAVQTCQEMVQLRNVLSHETGETDVRKILEAQQQAAQTMDRFLTVVFEKVKDTTSDQVLAEIFHKQYLLYLDQIQQNWFFLSDFLSNEAYDYSKFSNACLIAGIECRMDDGRYLFRSSNLERDLCVLKNQLAIREEYSKSTPVAQVKPALPLKAIAAIAAAVVLLGVGSVLVTTLRNARLFDNFFASQQEDFADQAGDLLNNALSQFGDATTTTTTAAATTTTTTQAGVGSGVNEIPAEYQDKMLALQYGSDLALLNATIEVKIGDPQSVPCASTWGKGTIYSADTSIAVGGDDGVLVYGVSPGETYIVFKSKLGSTQAYRVVVY